MAEIPEFDFIRDEPLDGNDESFFNFYHDSLAPAMREVVNSPNSPRTIGIFGSWGTGKSTIIKMLEKDAKISYPIFVFDSWKYQQDALRRTFLIELKDFMVNKLRLANIPEDFLEDFYSNTAREKPVKIIAVKPKWYKALFMWLKKNWLFDVFIGSLLVGIILVGFFNRSELVNTIAGFLKALSTVAFITFLGKELLSGYLGQMLKVMTELKQASLADGKITYTKNRLNSPEEFEQKFKDLLEYIKEEKVIIVFDNIDRVSGDVAVSMLSTIKTFMEPRGDSKVISVIPCDPTAITERVVSFYTKKNSGLGRDMADEYLRKIFNLILWLPDYISADLEVYTRQKLKDTGAISKLTLNDDVVLVINSAYKKNPRDIIQFINNLTALLISAHYSKIKDLLLSDVAYLAKVQVIRQKFPEAYKKLQENWNNPEDISLDDSDFKSFMLSTNRITVGDAEPFVFFKSPLDNYGLKSAEAIQIALTTGDTEGFKKLIVKVDKGSLTRMLESLMKKYRNMDTELTNIYNTQFSGLFEAVPDENRKAYLDFLVRFVDTDIWRNYKKISVDDTFKLIAEPQVKRAHKTAITERFMQSLEIDNGVSKSPDVDICLAVISNSLKYPPLFSKSDILRISQLIEGPELNNKAIVLLKDAESRSNYVSDAALQNFLKNAPLSTFRQSMSIFAKYKDVVVSAKTTSAHLSTLTARMQTENETHPAFDDTKNQLNQSVRKFLQTFTDEIDENSMPDAETLVVLIQANFNNSTQLQDRIDHLLTLWWLRKHVAQTTKDNIINTYVNFINSSGKGEIEQLFDNWSVNNLRTIIKQYFNTPLYTKATTDLELSKYLYSVLDEETGSEFIKYIVDNAPTGSGIDPDLIAAVGTLHNPEIVVESVTTKLESSQEVDERYTPVFEKLVKKNGPSGTKQRLSEYVSFLLTSDDADLTSFGIELFRNQALTKENKTNIIEALKQHITDLPIPYDEYDFQKILFFMQEKAFTDNITVSNITTNLFSILDQQVSSEVADRIFQAFEALDGITYATDTNLVSKAVGSVAAWPDINLKKYVLPKFKLFTSKKQTKDERRFWSELDSTLASLEIDEES